MSQYQVVILWSEEDSAFLAVAPELPGCMAHGATRDEALQMVEQAMELWLDVARLHGDRIPLPAKRRIAWSSHAEKGL
ncbi:type II toxin-antitoxin system HicB family antitoxin [Longimicrobium sp.]|uniref:type II toxin-antitoxin system HicB family antitoxin n=1 Tax=Longimicrobium sp. TaxID=2029185 RepID=UPI002BDEB407|nr:type II toxin-antitoxin system HicB family antitoxin [Longimicrobium sp.]HSU15237.1 type II toxin-antitoxin system HicB family antitoxin [Longimicrobium sp.]